jgi:hypothetical protein
MVSSVKSVPNQYQTLGLAPTASQNEIAEAFARAMSMYGARSLEAAARIGAAFEVLRNPAKRRAYDGSIGLRQEPYRWTSGGSNGFMGSAWGDLAGRIAADNPPPVRRPGLQSRLESGAEPRVASFIASSLREPPIPMPATNVHEPIGEATEEQAREERSKVVMDRHLADVLAANAVDRESSGDGQVRPLEWKRPALALGGLVVAAGFIGSLAGLWVQDSANTTPPQPQTTVTVPLPKPDATAATAEASVPTAPETQPEPEPAKVAAVTTPRVVTPQPASPPVQEAAENPSPTAPSASAVQAASDQLAAESPAAPVAEAKMPLPNATIARTIDRIGYSCGTVSSIAAMDGAGVFKVTCSSGQEYRATPVNGRYHFHKLGG